MRAILKFSACLLLCATALLRAADAPEGVEIADYKGWPGSVILGGKDSKAKVVIVPAVGGRILHYGMNDENIIFEVPGSDGKVLKNGKISSWIGGYNCDIGPETRKPPAHEILWVGPHKASATKPYSVSTVSEPDAVSGIQMLKDFTLDPKTGAVTIVQRMKNISDKDTTFCLWDRTLCKGGGFVLMPINKKSKHDKGWALRLKMYGEDAFDTKTPDSPNVKVMDGVLVAQATGKDVKNGKLGVDSDAGWMAFTVGKTLYIKSFPYYADGVYTDSGNSQEFYWSPEVGEIEPLSPEKKLQPGEEYTFTETWQLLPLETEVTTFEQARALVDKAAAAVNALKK
jgi:hypothetical protein